MPKFQTLKKAKLRAWRSFNKYVALKISEPDEVTEFCCMNDAFDLLVASGYGIGEYEEIRTKYIALYDELLEKRK